ncbi:MAG: 3'-5' exonuclease [Chitinophagaceae bacterium]
MCCGGYRNHRVSNEDSIIEIGASLFINGKLHDEFHSLVYTKRKIPFAVVSLTGISNDAIQRAPKADVVFIIFKKFIGNYSLVFHNAPFDMRFLNRYADYFGKPITNSIHDTLSIARLKLPNLANHKLSTLIEYFELEVNQTHRAKDDSIATGLLYVHLSGLKKPKVSRKANLK